MLDPNISDQEKKCLRILAKLFSESKPLVRSPLADLQREGLEADSRSLDVLLRMMERYGAIVDVSRTNAQEFRMFTIPGTVVQLVRELDELEKQEQEPGDIVEKVNDAARKNRVIGWVLIVSFVSAAILTIANQGIQLAQNLGWMAKP